MKAFIFPFLFVVFFNHTVIAQFYNLPAKQNYNRAKISLKDYTRIEATKLSIEKDSIQFFIPQTLQPQRKSIDEINYLRVQTGTQTLTWALYGGLFMATACLVGMTDVETNPNLEYKDNVGKIVAGLIGGGVLVGALIGTAIPKWKTYYIQKNTASMMPLTYDFYACKDHFGITVKMNF